jgi:stage III sporulation protein SpoIIIAA
MKPDWLAVDEITAEADCQALLHAGWCGVSLIAAIHAAGLEDFMHRPVYRPLVKTKLFAHYIVMQPDKSWMQERTSLCTSR